jgi:nucleoside-diphosphate kinase
MSSERTFSIIKPDAVANRHIGDILAMLEKEGFRILGLRRTRLTAPEAEGFYVVHRGKPFFTSLVKFMTSGPIVVMALERDDAVRKLREVMGATDPAKANDGTIRKLYAENIERNCIHGSDAQDTAATELNYFFRAVELG